MKFTTPMSRGTKGQLRCHTCRKAFQMKDGDWHDRGSQQVFLCNRCENTLREEMRQDYGKSKSSNKS